MFRKPFLFCFLDKSLWIKISHLMVCLYVLKVFYGLGLLLRIQSFFQKWSLQLYLMESSHQLLNLMLENRSPQWHFCWLISSIFEQVYVWWYSLIFYFDLILQLIQLYQIQIYQKCYYTQRNQREFKILSIKKQNMRTKRQTYSNHDSINLAKLAEYQNWKQTKTKQSGRINALQKQNEKLLRQNMALRSQNKELLKYRQMHFKTNLLKLQTSHEIIPNVSPHYEFQTKINKRYCHQRSNSTTQECSIKSARRLVENADRGYFDKFQIQKKFNSEKYYSLKKKKFDYGISPENNLNNQDIFIQTKKSIDQVQVSDFLLPLRQSEDYEKPQTIHQSIAYNNKKQEFKTKIYENIDQILAKQPLQSHTIKIDELQKELKHLRLIQSKLLDRIHERDDIIQKLQQLLSNLTPTNPVQKLKQTRQPEIQSKDCLDTPKKKSF